MVGSKAEWLLWGVRFLFLAICGECERKKSCCSSGRGGFSRNLEISQRRMVIALPVGLVMVVQALAEAESKIVDIYEGDLWG